MKELNSFYNNELITGVAILSVLKKTKTLEISKVLLINPLLSYSAILNFVKKRSVKIRSIEELIMKGNITFTNFNKRYLESLELSINSILLLRQLKLIRIEDNKVISTELEFDFNNKTLGSRAKEVSIAASNLSEMIKREDASNLYLSLRIEI